MASAFLEYLLAAPVTLLVTLDPPGLAPIFLGLTSGMTARARAMVALRAVLIAGGVLAGFALIGDWLLRQLGVSLQAFRISGGLLLFWIAFEMVFDLRARRKASAAEDVMQEDRLRDLAAFPLAIPLLAGPGAITATLLLAGRANGDIRLLAVLLGVVAVVLASCYAAFLAAAAVDRLLGRTGNSILTRLLGVVLAALAVQFVIDGVRTALTVP